MGISMHPSRLALDSLNVWHWGRQPDLLWCNVTSHDHLASQLTWRPLSTSVKSQRLWPSRLLQLPPLVFFLLFFSLAGKLQAVLRDLLSPASEAEGQKILMEKLSKYSSRYRGKITLFDIETSKLGGGEKG